MKSESWGIVGGGIMGITLALRLSEMGYRVTLFEAAPELGGLVSSWKMNDVEWDKFYHVILLSDFKTRDLLKQVGLEDKIEWVETKTGFYMNGKLYSMSDTVEFLKFPTLNLIDKFRLGLTILVASRIKNWKRLEKIPVTDWLQRWSGKNTYQKVWLPLLRAKLGDSYTKTSAVFIWATIQRLYGARRSGLKKEMFGYLPGGYKRIVSALKDKLISRGVQIHTGYAAREITIGPVSKPVIHFAANEPMEFDKVVSTLPAGLSAKLCTGLTIKEIKKLEGIEYLGVICVAVLLNKPVSNFYITNITDSWVPFTGVIEMSALVDKKYLGNNALVYLPKYVSPYDPLFNYSDEEIKKFFLSNFKKMYPWLTDEDIKFAGVARAKHVITVLTENYSRNLPDVVTTIPGVYIINTAYIQDGTLNVNETIKVADDKLTQIMADA
ncbi:MAG: NAD(P)/FAD-dependent oxidoreductase [Ferruginibacter sp.]|nr:NAD(P)/FAD-dependent oxidoreductase [Bacteroidota bacterium]MBX2917924.1 NAD(P)/FAD-dependent oxidoreductase [Ferruginibacter sp.]MCB0709200.1 NAD(P)/FAD-dependent oxidoreductase [Chitinophagaceae bacterium]MCC7377956.1 NAD(P)/FAD-dependent oxidoreductase [Chitinophagaceae bacterium]